MQHIHNIPGVWLSQWTRVVASEWRELNFVTNHSGASALPSANQQPQATIFCRDGTRRAGVALGLSVVITRCALRTLTALNLFQLSSRRTKSQAMPLGTGSPYPAGRMSWNIAPFFLILAFSPFTIERRPLQPLPRFWREKETIYLARYGVAALANALQGL